MFLREKLILFHHTLYVFKRLYSFKIFSNLLLWLALQPHAAPNDLLALWHSSCNVAPQEVVLQVPQWPGLIHHQGLGQALEQLGHQGGPTAGCVHDAHHIFLRWWVSQLCR